MSDNLPFSTKLMNVDARASAAETNYANKKGFYITFNSMFVAGRVDFKAFLNGYHDNFTTDWSSENPYGRIDTIKTFNRTTRMIDMSFSIPAYSAEEAEDNLAKVSALIKMMYPSYENRAWSAASFVRTDESPDDTTRSNLHSSTSETDSSNDRFCLSAPPLITVKFANLIKTIRPEDLPPPGSPSLDETFLDGKMEGVIAAVTNLSVNPRVDVGFFHKKDGVGWMYPKLLDVSIQFNVLHQVSPGIAAQDFTTVAAAGTYGDLYGVGYGKVDGSANTPVWPNTPSLSIAGARAQLTSQGAGRTLATNPGGVIPAPVPDGSVGKENLSNAKKVVGNGDSSDNDDQGR